MSTETKKEPIKQLRITNWHIERGEGGNPTYCAIALALRGRFRTDDVSVDCGGIRVRGKYYVISAQTARFIDQFDDWKDEEEGVRKPRPFCLKLKLDLEAMREAEEEGDD